MTLNAVLSVFHLKQRETKRWTHGESNQNNINYTLIYSLYHQMNFIFRRTI